MYETLKTDFENHILVVTLNRPDRMNAYTVQMQEELIKVLDIADGNDEVRAVVITGAGKAFCAGMDLENGGQTFEDSETPDEVYRDSGGVLSLRIFESTKPIIAAINGAAVGIGITMTLPMDIRVVSTDAKIGFVFSRRGITPEAGSGWFLPRLVGIGKALEWVLTGRILSAQEALSGGLANKIVPPEEVLPAAMEIAAEIAENTSAISVALSRQLLWKMLGEEHPMNSHRMESKMIQWTGKHADAHEGINSFLEKRKANFTMKPSTDMPDFFPWWDDKRF